MLNVKSFTFSPIQENTYIVYNEQKVAAIIDPGCYFPQEKEKLKSFIESEGLKPVLLLNTHCHLDHVFGNQYVFDTWQLQPHIHPLEKQVHVCSEEAGIKWGIPFESYKGEFIYLKEGTDILLGTDKLNILFTPGHSPGSVSFYCEEQDLVIAGDVLFDRSIGRTDLPGGNYETLINSIQTQLFTLPDNTKVYPGHGNPTTTGFEKMNNPFVKMY